MYAFLDQWRTLCCPLVSGDEVERQALARDLVHLSEASSRRQAEQAALAEGARLEAKLAQVYQECELLRSRLSVYENGTASGYSGSSQASSGSSKLGGRATDPYYGLAPVREEESAKERDSDDEDDKHAAPSKEGNTSAGPRLLQRRSSQQSDVSSLMLEEDSNATATTPLLASVREGDLLVVVKLLRGKRGDVNVADAEGVTPLMSACAKGHEQLVDVLLSSGADPNLADMDGVAPLQAAAYDGYGSIVQRLLQSRAKVDMVDKDGFSALHLVAGSCTSIEHESLVVQLLNAKADPTLSAADNTTPAQLAEEAGNQRVSDLLRQAEGERNGQRRKKRSSSVEARAGAGAGGGGVGAVADEPGSLLLAAQDGTIDEVRRLCAQGLLPKAGTDIHGQSPLHLAAARGRVEIVEALLAAGADKDVPDGSRTTPLHVAAHEGHAQVVTALCQSGASVSRGDSQSMSPLHAACLAGHHGVMKALTNAGAKLHDENKAGRSPLHLAASSGHLLVVQGLLELRADANAQDLTGLTPLELCQSDNRALEDLLLKQMEDEPDNDEGDMQDSGSIIV